MNLFILDIIKFLEFPELTFDGLNPSKKLFMIKYFIVKEKVNTNTKRKNRIFFLWLNYQYFRELSDFFEI